MCRFLFGFWLPLFVLLCVAAPALAGFWIFVPVILVPAWLLYCLLVD